MISHPMIFFCTVFLSFGHIRKIVSDDLNCWSVRRETSSIQRVWLIPEFFLLMQHKSFIPSLGSGGSTWKSSQQILPGSAAVPWVLWPLLGGTGSCRDIPAWPCMSPAWRKVNENILRWFLRIFGPTGMWKIILNFNLWYRRVVWVEREIKVPTGTP